MSLPPDPVPWVPQPQQATDSQLLPGHLYWAEDGFSARAWSDQPLREETLIHLFDGETQAGLQIGSDPQARGTKSQVKLARRGSGCHDSLQESSGEDTAWVVIVTKCNL